MWAKTILRLVRSQWCLWFYLLAFNLADTIIFYSLSRIDYDRYPYTVISLALDIPVLVMIILDRVTPRIVQKANSVATPEEDEDVNLPPPRVVKAAKWIKRLKPVFKWFKAFLWLFIMGMCIVRVIYIAYLPPADEFLTPADRNSFIVVTIFAVIADCGVLTIWWKRSIRTTHGLMTLALAIQMLLGIVIIQVNIDLFKKLQPFTRIHNMFVFDGAFVLAEGLMGILLAMLVTDKNRLNEVVGRIVFIYDVFVLVVTALTVALLICVFPGLHYGQDVMPVTNPIFFGVLIALAIVCFFCLRFLRVRFPSTDLEVLDYDLVGLTEKQRNGWAKVIDINHKLNAGVSGDAVVSLMNAYCQADLPGMECKVLRVCKKTAVKSKGGQDIKKAWEGLDHEDLLFKNERRESVWTDNTTVLDEFKPLSKTKLKRMAKKQKDNKAMELLEELLAKMELFYEELVNTEALILITIVSEFDLTERIPAKFGGKFLHRMFGKGLKYPIMVLKFGLLGFHWPFKRLTFYTLATKKPVARSAAIMHALSKWNNKHAKCLVLLDPTYKHDYAETGIRFSGWYKVGLPATHIADLRPFKNKLLQQYFKAIKYRVQDKAFVEAGGEVIELKDPDMKACEEIVDLNEMIGDARSDNDQSDTLLHPTAQFVYDLCHIDNKQKYRSLLFLKVNGSYIALCIIFRLGDTMTMDVNGIDYGADAKQFKAYFVLMQEVIRLALNEGISFVDFGPTTENAKVDIGCSVVPLVGSLYPKMKALGPVVKFAADMVDV